MTQTGSRDVTRFFELGPAGLTEAFPCRCGLTHRGDYAQEDWNHHNCLHRSDLVDVGDGMVVCMDCGETWQVTPATGSTD